MEVSIITGMTCMFAVALTMGGPIRRQATQPELTVRISGENVTLVCPFVPDGTWQWVYWKKDNQTIYSLEVQSSPQVTKDQKYEVSNHATRLKIKDLEKTDSGIYHCKVATNATNHFIKEGGQVLLSVKDQEVGLSTTSPVISFSASTTIPPQPPEDHKICLAVSIPVLIITIIINIAVCYIFKYYWERIRNLPAGCVGAFRRLFHLSPPLALDDSNSETRDEESTRTNLLSSDTHDLGDVDVDDRPEENSNSSHALTSETGEKQLPLVGPVLIDDLYCASACNRKSIVKCLTKVLHSLVEKYKGEGVPPKGGKYSASLMKYANSGNRCVTKDVLEDVEYFLDELDHIPVGRKRDVCELLLTMPENQEVDTSMTYSNTDIFVDCDQGNHASAVKHELKSRTTTLGSRMRTILSKSEKRDVARNYISLIILDAPVDKSRSSSFSRGAASTFNQPASETDQNLSVSFRETNFLLQRDEDSKREDDNLKEFWLSKLIKLQPEVQRRVMRQFNDSMEKATDSPHMQNDDDKEVENTDLNESTDRDKATNPPDMQNDDAKEVKNTDLNKSTEREKTMDPPHMQNDDDKEVENTDLNESTDREPQPQPQPLEFLWPLKVNLNLLSREQLINIQNSNEQVSAEARHLMDIIEKTTKEIHDKDQDK